MSFHFEFKSYLIVLFLQSRDKKEKQAFEIDFRGLGNKLNPGSKTGLKQTKKAVNIIRKARLREEDSH